ncbi:invasion associated locus B family protein [Rhizobiaceae bacterium BDR2-2]|uniref:Invasion associated locus B family protein n=1 Tax=Ectorhizobium quercum TaxID=2965071 RepID=A0AAE3SWS1_9HYPH|nr:invasion associated locus B family protein [Ectorhizobium quercum]MCX8999710.1 invasion associated locus B family protein [Ectorhizobium quercum]
MMDHTLAFASLFSTTATIRLRAKGNNEASAWNRPGPVLPEAACWTIERTGPEGHEVSVVRYIEHRGGLPKVMIDLGFASGGEMRGILVLPAGLEASDGVRLRIDDAGLTRKIPIAANSPARCVVKLHFDRMAVEQLEYAEKLDIHAYTVSRNRTIAFSVPLAGFAASTEMLRGMGRHLPS